MAIKSFSRDVSGGGTKPKGGSLAKSGPTRSAPLATQQKSIPSPFVDRGSLRGAYTSPVVPANQQAIGSRAAQLGGGMSGVPYVSPTGAAATGSMSPYGGTNMTGSPVSGSIAQYGYTPQGMADIYSEPAILAQDILQAMGINNPGLAQSLAEYFGPALAAHFLQSGGGVGGSGSDAASLSGANDYLTQYVTPNGQVPGFQELASLILDAAGDPNSLIGAYLGSTPGSTLSTKDQINNVNQLFGQALSGSNPYSQEAYSNYLQDETLGYQSGLAKGAPGGSSYADYILNSQLPRWVAGR